MFIVFGNPKILVYINTGPRYFKLKLVRFRSFGFSYKLNRTENHLVVRCNFYIFSALHNIMNCIIIDDEPHSIEGLSRYISTIPRLKLIGCFTEPLALIEQIDRLDKVDLAFVDVDMPLINGIELAKAVRFKIGKLIFTTGHKEYAYDAFDADADAFLLKPYTLLKFATTIKRLFPEFSDYQDSTLKEEYFFIKSKKEHFRLVKVHFNEVVAVESRLNHIMIHTTDAQILSYMSLKEISPIFKAKSGFEQFHRSYIINTQRIKQVEGNTITLDGATKVTVGEQYREHFNRFINNKLIRTGGGKSPA